MNNIFHKLHNTKFNLEIYDNGNGRYKMENNNVDLMFQCRMYFGKETIIELSRPLTN